MNIHLAKKGSKVRFMNRGGWDGEFESVSEKLTKGEVYIVDRVGLYQSSSEVYLEGFGDEGFNSVFFEDVGLADYFKVLEHTNEEFTNFLRERLDSMLIWKELEQFMITIDEDEDDEMDEKERIVVVDAKVTGALWTFWFEVDTGKYSYDVLGEHAVKRFLAIDAGKKPEPPGLYTFDNNESEVRQVRNRALILLGALAVNDDQIAKGMSVLDGNLDAFEGIKSS